MNDKLNILVVDDEELILDIFQTYLGEASNYSVLTAKDGHEALNIIKNKEVDCCFTDLSMPNMDGTELAGRIQAYDNTIPVVVMTGHPSVENAIQTLKSGVVDFLTKPFKVEQIPLVIERIMREKALFVDNIFLKEEAEKNRRLSSINKELHQKIKDVETVNIILQELNQAANSKELFDILVNLAGQLTGCDEAHLCFYNQELKEHVVIASFFKDPSSVAAGSPYVETSLVNQVVADAMPCLIKGKNGNGGTAAVPLKIRSSIFGILVASMHNGGEHFNEKDIYFLNFLSDKASFLIENLALYENIYENLFSTLYAFVETIEARDPYTKQHSARVSRYAMAMAKACGRSQDEIEGLNVAGYLHDIGKIGIPDSILLKPGKLTNEEYEIIKKHPTIGSNIIRHLGMWAGEQSLIRHHHERYDGKGYPDGLQGKDIPVLSRILAVADVFDALTTDRSYRKKMSNEVAVNIIRENSGTQFDHKMVEVFLDLWHAGTISSLPLEAEVQIEKDAIGRRPIPKQK